jgi:hypothetical protein
MVVAAAWRCQDVFFSGLEIFRELFENENCCKTGRFYHLEAGRRATSAIHFSVYPDLMWIQKKISFTKVKNIC